MSVTNVSMQRSFIELKSIDSASSYDLLNVIQLLDYDNIHIYWLHEYNIKMNTFLWHDQ